MALRPTMAANLTVTWFTQNPSRSTLAPGNRRHAQTDKEHLCSLFLTACIAHVDRPSASGRVLRAGQTSAPSFLYFCLLSLVPYTKFALQFGPVVQWIE